MCLTLLFVLPQVKNGGRCHGLATALDAVENPLGALY
jgi:hypothetical protein